MQVNQHDFAVILHHMDDTAHILLLQDNRLPSVQPERHFWQSCATVNDTIQATYGLRVITIRPLTTAYHPLNDDKAEFQVVYLM